MTHCNNIDCPCTERAIERAENEAWFAAHEPDPLGWAADRAADRYERQRDSAW